MGKFPRKWNPYSNVISTSETLNDQNVQPLPLNRSFDLVCFHVLYNRAAFEKYLPKDTTYIGIMRDPYGMFRSILSYFRPRQVLGYKGKDPITEFFEKGNYMGMGDIFLTANPLAYEYGAPIELQQNHNTTLLNAFIKQLEQEFRMIIISDFFEESMVLMRRLLNWGTKDVLYVDLNVSNKSNFKVVATSKHRDLVYKRASLDVVIYKHFYRRLWQQIREEGDDFFDELLEYRRLRRKVNIFCSEKEYQTDNVMVVEKTPWSEGFEVKYMDCKLMTMFEMHFTKMIREKQWGPQISEQVESEYHS
ncbi:hypothetical protein FSP39_024896 [Pinctada imbricata]|uniref:Uncharacterized protein n=1 Tax=Pinctada imbricata TaxID=66713 RepID=A0AA89C7K9_PINIB|nr:hypothetical protein FSP39_024896 [Pinctada imbricata]